MIVNELQYAELLDLLRPILRLESRDTISQTFESILKMPAGTTLSDPLHEKPLLKYKGYKLDITHFCWFDAKGMAIHLHFNAYAPFGIPGPDAGRDVLRNGRRNPAAA